MKTEELIEEGIVEQVNDGIAIIRIHETGSCEECSAKLFCKPKDSQDRTLTVRDKFGVVPGDNVRVSLKGKNLVLASLLLYGIPLLILILSLVIGMKLFGNSEALSFLFAMILMIKYYILIYFISKKSTNNLMPEIVFVKPVL